MKTIFDRLFRLAAGSPLRRNVSAGSLAHVGHVVIGLAALPIYLHFLGYELYGVWVVIATVLGFSQVGNFGLAPSICKYVAEARAKGASDEVKRYVSSAAAGLTGTGVLAFILLTVLRWPLVALFGLEGSPASLIAAVLPAAGLLVGYSFVVKTFDGTLSGLGRVDLTAWIRLMGRGTGFALAVGLLWRGFGVWALLAGQSAAEVVSHVLFAMAIRRQSGGGLLDLRLVRWASMRQLYRLGAGVAASSSLDMAFVPFTKLMITRLVGLPAVAVFDIANNVAQNVRGLVGAGMGAVNPEVSARLAAGADVRPLLGRLARIFGTAAGLLGLVLAGGAVPILRLWLGARYDPAIVTPLRILLVGAALFVVSLPWHYGAIGAGDATGVAVAAALRAGVNAAAVSCVALTIGLTLPRAAVAASCAFGVSTVFLVWRGRSRLGPSLGQAAERVTTTGTSAR